MVSSVSRRHPKLSVRLGSGRNRRFSEQRMTFSDAFFFCHQPGGRECPATSLDEFSPAT